MLFGLRDLNGVAMDEAVTEKPVCPGLVASFLVLLGESESPCGKLPGILQAAGPGERPRSVEQRRSHDLTSCAWRQPARPLAQGVGMLR